LGLAGSLAGLHSKSMVAALAALHGFRRVPGRAVHADLLHQQTVDGLGERHRRGAPRLVGYKASARGGAKPSWPRGGLWTPVTELPVGLEAVRIARTSIATALSEDGPRDPAAPFRSVPLAPLFDEPRGVFVTLTQARGGALRGCIGFPVPVYPLRAAIP